MTITVEVSDCKREIHSFEDLIASAYETAMEFGRQLVKETLESLVVAGLLAALLLYRNGLAPSYTDALMEAMKNADNVFTVLVMALMGAVTTLVEGSGAVTALQKWADRKLRSRRGVFFGALGVMAVTAIDDCLNMLCAASTIRNAADEQKLPREKTGLLLSLLPTVLSSFLPFSLWGIFVIGTIGASMPGTGAATFCRAIPAICCPCSCWP